MAKKSQKKPNDLPESNARALNAPTANAPTAAARVKSVRAQVELRFADRSSLSGLTLERDYKEGVDVLDVDLNGLLRGSLGPYRMQVDELERKLFCAAEAEAASKAERDEAVDQCRDLRNELAKLRQALGAPGESDE